MTGGLALRILPPGLVVPRRARYVLERNVLVYRRAWMIIFSGFFEPMFYLFSIGIGLGRLVGEVGSGTTAVTYATFVAPGLLAASAMNGAVLESTMNIFFKLRYARTYDGMLATPVGPFDIVVGEITWSQLRGLLYAVGFLVVMGALGLLASPLAGLLALPAVMLVGFAFAAVGMAAATYMTSWQHFDLVQLAILPLFLFSATFFPAEVYPEAIRGLLVLSPLYHGVELLRGLTLGTADAGTWGHVAFLLAMTLAGLVIAVRRVERLLLS
jgi:lipooligosaccharide transport system permease protein